MSPKITVPNIKANTVRPREDASFGADYAPLNGRTETGIGFCPSAIGRPGPDVLISMSI